MKNICGINLTKQLISNRQPNKTFIHSTIAVKWTINTADLFCTRRDISTMNNTVRQIENIKFLHEGYVSQQDERFPVITTVFSTSQLYYNYLKTKQKKCIDLVKTFGND